MVKHLKSLMAMGMVLVGGCSVCPLQKVENTPPEPVNPETVVMDPAMQLRTWDASTAYYGNGNVVAGPTEFPYIPRWGQPEPYYVVEETPLFLGQAALIWIPMIFTPPWTPVLYTGVTVEPTYTAMPLVPPRSEPTAEPMVAPTTQP
jgi:hypothetical protein